MSARIYVYVQAVIISVSVLFIVNYFIRVSGPADISSTGILINYLQSHNVVANILSLCGLYLVVLAIQWIYFIKRGFAIPGVGKFWKLVANNPDKAYEWFQGSEASKVLDYPLPSHYRQFVPESDWAGPFDLYVPMINSRVSIFGRSGLYESSRDEFIRKIKDENKSV